MTTVTMDEEEREAMQRNLITEHTSYLRWSTELEATKDIVNGAFLQRNHISIIGLNKFAPLANFKDPAMMRLHKLKMLIIDLDLEAGLMDDAEQTALSIIDDIQVSRGDNGFFQKALITQRQELESKELTSVQKKAGIFNKLFSGKKQEEQQSGGVPPQ